MPNPNQINANKEIIRQFIRRVFNEQNAEATRDFVTADVQWHGGSLGTIKGPDAMTNLFKGFFTALPDLHATELALIADMDTVWFHFAVEGTNRGSLFGQPPTGKKVRWEEIDVYRVSDGKIVEEWSSADVVNILHQVGAYTPPWMR